MLSLCSSSSLKSYFLRSYACTTRASTIKLSKSASNAIPSLACFPRYIRTMPPGASVRQEAPDASSPPAEFVGESGRRYVIKEVLQERHHRRVILAMSGTEKFVLKDVSASHFNYVQNLYDRLGKKPYIRISEDVIPDQSMFVYRYLEDHFLGFAQRKLPIMLTKRILRDTLRGLAALHNEGIVHADVKANNILVDWEDGPHGIVIKEVQLSDIDDAAYLKPTSDIVGLKVGNMIWRSPEANVEGRVNKPSDIFSFGIVCIYAVTRRLILHVEPESLGEGELALAVVLERQISYFADVEGMEGFLKHLGDSPWCKVIETIRDEFNESNPRKPVSLWQGIDKEFRDFITGLTKFDPSKRLTAEEALQHPWLRDVV